MTIVLLTHLDSFSGKQSNWAFYEIIRVSRTIDKKTPEIASIRVGLWTPVTINDVVYES